MMFFQINMCRGPWNFQSQNLLNENFLHSQCLQNMQRNHQNANLQDILESFSFSPSILEAKKKYGN